MNTFEAPQSPNKSTVVRFMIVSILLSSNTPATAQTVQDTRQRYIPQPEFVSCQLAEVGLFPSPVAGDQGFRVFVYGTQLPTRFTATFIQGRTHRTAPGSFIPLHRNDDGERTGHYYIGLHRSSAISLRQPFSLDITMAGLGTRRCTVSGFRIVHVR